MSQDPLSALTRRERRRVLELARDQARRAAPETFPSISSADRTAPLPLSFAQQRLWFLAQMGQSESYHSSLQLRLIGGLNTHALRRALHRIVERHEGLRTRFVMVEGVAEQRIVSAEQGSFGWEEHDIRSAQEPRAERQRVMREALQRPFDLERGPLMHVRLLREAEHEHALLITMHHIVSDGWSIGVLLSELSALYGAYVKGEEDPLPPLPMQYVDYAQWQRRWMSTQIQQEQAEYWKKALEGAPALLELPWDHARPVHQDYAGDALECVLDRQLTRELKELSRRQGTTLFMTLLASWALLLGRLSGQPEVVIGTTAANRRRRELEKLIGFFVNTLAIRVDVSGSPSVAELLRRVKEQTLHAQQHQDIPFDQVVELVNPARTLAHSPIFQSMFTWQNAPVSVPVLPGLEIEPIADLPQVTAKFDLSPTLGEWDGEIRGNLEYATALFERETVERYLKYWKHLLEQMVRSDDVEIDRLAPLTAEEREYLQRRSASTRIVNRRAEPAEETGTLPYEPPQGPTETLVADVWASLLPQQQISRHANFFEVGGYSLLAVTVVERLRKHGLQANVRALFMSATLAEFAAEISGRATTASVPPNLIPPDCDDIRPEMLPLVTLTAAEIEQITRTVQGGARNVQDVYPLAPLQDGMLFHHLLTPQQDPYVLAGLIAFDNRERLNAYLEALQAVIDRHDVLRTAFLWEGLSGPVQVVLKKAALPIEHVHVDAASGDVAEQLLQRARDLRIDLRQAPLIRVQVTYDAANERWLMLGLFHHMTGDHSSVQMLDAEIGAHLAGEQHRLSTPISFRNFVARARLHVTEQEHEAFFRALLQDVTEPTSPFGLGDAHSAAGALEQARLELTPPVAESLRRCARKHSVTVATLCHLAWALVLARVSGKTDVVFGTVLFGRMQGEQDSDRAIGLFINTLPVRIRVGAQNVRSCVRDTHALLAELLHHEHASLALAQRCSAVPAPMPLFLSLLNYRHNEQPATASATARHAWAGIRPLTVRDGTNYPVSLSVDDSGVELSVTAQIRTQPAVRAMHVCELMHTALVEVAQSLDASSDIALDALDVLPPAQLNMLLQEWSGAETTSAEHAARYVHQRFEDQVRRTPEAVALVDGAEQVTYADLNAHANRLARYILARGLTPDDRVVICLQRGLPMIVAWLATLKAGCACVPVDPQYPTERLQYMQEHAGARLVLSQGSLDAIGDTLQGLPASDIDPALLELTPDHLAYVVYTSGSTGQPKGIAMPHRALANLIAWESQNDYASPSERTLQFAALGFDVALQESFAALCTGGTLVLITEEQRLDVRALARVVREHSIERMFLPVAALQSLAEETRLEERLFEGVQDITTSGAQLRISPAIGGLFSRLRDCRLHNQYGPSETHAVTQLTLPKDPSSWPALPSIGRPVASAGIYILDSSLRPVPIGVSGEICIAGVGLARGYLQQPRMTAERFVPNPFGPAGSRLYRSGDLAKWVSDGTIEYLGRNDFQVKVRGFRVELGEIESQILQCAGIREAVVLAQDGDAGEKRLVAYYVADDTARIDPAQLRNHLRMSLPDYMLPAAYVQLESIPLTTNGKLDLRALPAWEDSAQSAREYLPPESEAEQVLARIWCEVLKRERVARSDNFFEVGGHSLLAMQVIARVHQALGVDVPLRELFVHPVLEEFARRVEQAASTLTPAITSARRDERIPLSFAQQRLWFLAQMGQSGMYHIPLALRIGGCLSVPSLRRALHRIVERHEGLRTRFVSVEGVAEQRIVSAEDGSFGWEEHDLRSEREPETERERLILEALQTPFDLERGPLMHVRLLREAEREHTLLITMHHIVSDGWSIGVLLSELSALYGAYVKGEEDPLPQLPVQYVDYAQWQRRWMSTQVQQEQAQYWTKTLEGAPALLELPWDHARPTQQDYAGDVLECVLDRELTQELKELSRRQGTTLFMTLLASWALLLARLSGQSEVVIGTTTANRHRRELEKLIGFFVNTLAIRVDVSGSPPVAELLRRVKEQTLQAQQHQDIPFDQVVELVKPERTLAHSPIFQTMFTWQNAPISVPVLPGLAIQPTTGSLYPTSKFDISLTLMERGDEIAGGIEYATALFERETIERYLRHWKHLLEQMVRSDDVDIGRLALLRAEEREQLLSRWNGAQVFHENEEKCLHELFEEQVQRTPDAVALVYEGEQLSYAQLNARANQLAHYLHARGIGPDQLVGVCVERSLEMVIALLAVLKAGAAYVPLDPRYPPDRLQYMLEDSAAPILLTTTDLMQKLPPSAAHVLALDEDGDRIALQAETNLPVTTTRAAPGHLAYVIYTSGSTGRPKGVMVEHRNVVRLYAATEEWFHFDSRDVWTLFHSFAFDFSVWEIWGALLYGGRLVVVSHAASRSAIEFYNLLCEHGVTVLNQTPSAFQQLAAAQAQSAHTHSLRYVIFSGEALELSALSTWYARNDADRTQLINMYGITETTVFVTYQPISPGDIDRRTPGSPIGVPLPDLRTYVLDRCGEPAAPGVTGEIYVGGLGVARGYLNRPALTAERFVTNPFGSGCGERLYRSGDVARYRPDGTLEYLGRNDQQVKIRGYRIELGEIEARLLEHPQVREAAVLAHTGAPEERRLVAYVTSVGSELDADSVRAHLRQLLPNHMVPAAVVQLEHLPLNPSGKLDRQRLPTPGEAHFSHASYEPPEGDAEAAIAAAWQDLLHIERVGRSDNFFELGGHSLLIVQMIERLRRVGWGLDVRSVFAAARLCDLAATATRVSAASSEVPENRVPVGCERIDPDMLTLIELNRQQIDRIVARVPGGAANVQEIYPLTPLQEGLLFHHRLSDQGDPYVTVSIEGFATRALLDRHLQALQSVIDRHDILRTAIMWEELARPAQAVLRQAALPIEELRLEPGDALDQLKRRFASGHVRIDVRQAPMMRAVIAEDRENDRWLCLLLQHHLIGDATSAQVLREEVCAYLQGAQDLLARPVPFRQIVARTHLGSDATEHDRFFRSMLADVDEPTAPFGVLNVRGSGADVAYASAMLEGERVASMRHCARRLGVAAAALFHLAWAQVLARLTDREQVVFGTILLGRMSGTEGEESSIGMLLNTLPLRIDVNDRPIEEALRGTHRALAELLHHEHASLAQAQRCSSVPASLPLFTTLLNFRHRPRGPVEAPSRVPLQGADLLHTQGQTSYPLGVSVSDVGSGFVIEVRAVSPIDPARICAWLERAISQQVAALMQTPRTPVRALDVMPPVERERVLATRDSHLASQPSYVQQLMEEHVRRAPQAVAVVDADKVLSYERLNERANRLARYLRANGVRGDRFVALCIDPDVDLVVGMLGILKAGGAYLPLDPSYPPERLAYMLRDSAPAAILTTAAVRALLPATSAPVILLDRDWPAIAHESAENLHAESLGLSPHSLAYMIYTSGSTGVPKGVMIEHGELAATLASARAVLDFRVGDVLPKLASPAFDISLLEMLMPLTSGGTTLILNRAQVIDPQQLLPLTTTTTHLNTVPSLAEAIMGYVTKEQAGVQFPALRTMMVGGDAVPRALLVKLREHFPQATIVEMYGPTECTLVSTFYGASAQRVHDVPHCIGTGFPGTRTYVLNRSLEPQPTGVVGELYIAGDGLARGYANRAALTAEKFVPDPFGTRGSRMYASGDLARWLDDHTLEYLGRNDFQTKIRGFRIELGEIEARLLAHPDIGEAIVLAREDTPGVKQLVAYYAPHVGKADLQRLDVAQIRAHLSAYLPEYMVPAAYVELERFPLTPNGKIDRRALPSPDLTGRGPDFEPPRGDIEIAIADVWQELLGVSRIGRNDNFFELGGHSLLTMQVVDLLKRRGLELSIASLLESPTPRELAHQVSRIAEPIEHHGRALQVRAGGDERPLFLAYDGSPSLLYAYVLAPALEPEIPVFGLPPVPAVDPQPGSVAAMAARLVPMILQVQPAGPYRIGGYSFGGLLACEIAAQLEAAGARVEFLGLIDTRAVADLEGSRLLAADAKRHLLHLVEDSIRYAHGDDPAERARFATVPSAAEMSFEELARHCRQERLLPDYLATQTDAEIAAYVARASLILAAALRHEVRPIAARIHLFNAGSRADDALGVVRGAVPAERVQLHIIEGSHQTMFAPRSRDQLGRLMSAAIRSADV